MTPPALLRTVLAHAAPRLEAVLDPGTPRTPGKWSPQQILGHLVDSATVNYGRFVRAGQGGGLVFEGYDQDAWVEAGRYAEADWPDLVALWRLLNEQLARLAEGLPADVLDAPHAVHSLDRIAWRLLPADEPATLGDLVEDYVGHLCHHLRQVDPALVPEG